MSLFSHTLPKATLAACLALNLSACLPNPEDLTADTEPEANAAPEAEPAGETNNHGHHDHKGHHDKHCLNLPETPFDYVSYADSNLPEHFTTGAQSVISRDNTPANNPITNTGATLGRVLFYDNALSVNDAVSCASCHQQKTGFSDDKALSEGFQGGLTARHSMSLANNRFYESGHFFWDERADTLEEQVLMPIQDDTEMGMTLDALVIKLAQLEHYPELFSGAFGDDAITAERISLALAQFTRAMVSYQSPYDNALSSAASADDLSHAFTADEEAGRILFEAIPPNGGFGCGGCHTGVTQSTERPHNIGLDLTSIDEGAGNGAFKVPSLRNVALSAPYMHDGRFDTLAQVIEHYNSGVLAHPNLDPFLKHPVTGLPVELNMSSTDKQQLEAFLNTLTDDEFTGSELFSDPFKKAH